MPKTKKGKRAAVSNEDEDGKEDGGNKRVRVRPAATPVEGKREDAEDMEAEDPWRFQPSINPTHPSYTREFDKNAFEKGFRPGEYDKQVDALPSTRSIYPADPRTTAPPGLSVQLDVNNFLNDPRILDFLSWVGMEFICTPQEDDIITWKNKEGSVEVMPAVTAWSECVFNADVKPGDTKLTSWKGTIGGDDSLFRSLTGEDGLDPFTLFVGGSRFIKLVKKGDTQTQWENFVNFIFDKTIPERNSNGRVDFYKKYFYIEANVAKRELEFMAFLKTPAISEYVVNTWYPNNVEGKGRAVNRALRQMNLANVNYHIGGINESATNLGIILQTLWLEDHYTKNVKTGITEESHAEALREMGDTLPDPESIFYDNGGKPAIKPELRPGNNKLDTVFKSDLAVKHRGELHKWLNKKMNEVVEGKEGKEDEVGAVDMVEEGKEDKWYMDNINTNGIYIVVDVKSAGHSILLLIKNGRLYTAGGSFYPEEDKDLAFIVYSPDDTIFKQPADHKAAPGRVIKKTNDYPRRQLAPGRVIPRMGQEETIKLVGFITTDIYKRLVDFTKETDWGRRYDAAGNQHGMTREFVHSNTEKYRMLASRCVGGYNCSTWVYSMIKGFKELFPNLLGNSTTPGDPRLAGPRTHLFNRNKTPSGFSVRGMFTSKTGKTGKTGGGKKTKRKKRRRKRKHTKKAKRKRRNKTKKRRKKMKNTRHRRKY